MKRFEIQGNTGQSMILVGETLENVKTYLPGTNPVIITDETVWSRYGNRFPTGEVIRIGTGETIKILETVERIYRRLVAVEADRSTPILGIGGGIVCDITGFAASTYLRGVRFGFVSTTLLAQVDASVGGKNGVNFGGYKNMIGVFNQPDFVVCDLSLLATLPESEIQCGFAEIIKHAAIADTEMFRFLEAGVENALSLDGNVIERLVYDSVRIKSAIVNRDETEQGERRKLNFGHTFGHAMEKVAGIPHGRAVSAGMAVAAALSVEKGLLSEKDADRLCRLIQRFGLPTRIDIDPGKVLEALGKDKKRSGDGIRFVLLSGLGNAVVEKISFDELSKAWVRFNRENPYDN